MSKKIKDDSNADVKKSIRKVLSKIELGAEYWDERGDYIANSEKGQKRKDFIVSFEPTVVVMLKVERGLEFFLQFGYFSERMDTYCGTKASTGLSVKRRNTDGVRDISDNRDELLLLFTFLSSITRNEKRECPDIDGHPYKKMHDGAVAWSKRVMCSREMVSFRPRDKLSRPRNRGMAEQTSFLGLRKKKYVDPCQPRKEADSPRPREGRMQGGSAAGGRCQFNRHFMRVISGTRMPQQNLTEHSDIQISSEKLPQM